MLLDPKGSYHRGLGLADGPYPIVYLLDAQGRVTWIGAPINRKRFAKACTDQLERAVRAVRAVKGAAAGPNTSGR